MDPKDLLARIRPADLARALNVAAPTFYKWTRIPAERCKAISAATGIPLWELRPDLWDAPQP